MQIPSLREMVQVIQPVQTPHDTEAAPTDRVGIGWFLTSSQHHLLAEHVGADPSTAAYVGWLPDVDRAIFMATNTGKNPTAVAVTAKALLEMVGSSLEGEY